MDPRKTSVILDPGDNGFIKGEVLSQDFHDKVLYPSRNHFAVPLCFDSNTMLWFSTNLEAGVTFERLA